MTRAARHGLWTDAACYHVLNRELSLIPLMP